MKKRSLSQVRALYAIAALMLLSVSVSRAANDGGDPSGQGPPVFGDIIGHTSGAVHFQWHNTHMRSDWMQACAYDLYNERWVEQNDGYGPWANLDATGTTGSLHLGPSGAYFAWIANGYGSMGGGMMGGGMMGPRYTSEDPATFIHYNGTPHTPLNFEAEYLGSGEVRMQWKPEIYGTWLNWMIAYDMTNHGWVEMDGPQGTSFWHYTHFGELGFEAGEMNLTIHEAGEYMFFMMPMAWDGQTMGDVVMTPVTVQ